MWSPKIPTKVAQLVALVALVALTILLFPRYNTAFRYHFEVGKPWGYELLTAEFDFPIYKTDAQLETERQQLLSGFAPCFVYVAEPVTQFVVSSEDMDILLQEGYSQISVVDHKNRRRYPISEVYTPKSAYQRWQQEMKPTIQLDTALTNDLRTKLLASMAITQGMVQTGEKIIDKGEIVTERDYQILQSLRRASEDTAVGKHQLILSNVGEAILICLYISLFVMYLLVFRRSYLSSTSTVYFFALVSALIIVLSCLLIRYTHLSIYLIPFAWIPILSRVFFDSRTALFLHITNVLIIALMVPAPVEFFFIQVAVGMVAVASLGDMTRRAQLATTSAWIFATQAIAYTAYTFASTGEYTAIEPSSYLYFLVNALLIICSYGLIYIFEKLFRFVSSITLVELTDINLDLLHQLAEKAPGTFQHAMQVSNLATEAAKAIGANALLVRTGALYHDIGKLSNPLYFTENQQGMPNPLAYMAPEEAAQVVISHVAAGEELARKHHLPEAILQFIRSHHGTSLARYFYNTYCNAHPGELVDEKAYRYPGPKPATKEAAIVMIVDGIEARSRSLLDFSEEAIRKMVNEMIDMQIADGQLSETPLSFKDVEDIREVLVARLFAINHHRVAYPTLQKS